MINFDIVTRYLLRLTVRVEFAGSLQTGFWLSERFIVTCVHGFSRLSAGEELDVYYDEQFFKATVVAKDEVNDILLLATKGYESDLNVEFGEKPEIGDQLASWAYTQKFREGGEGLKLTFEGWARRPLSLKLSQGQVEPGMSGAPLVTLSSRKLIGMIKKTRDRNTSLGGRAVPACTIKEFVGNHISDYDRADQRYQVTRADLEMVFGILESAYETAKPVTTIQIAEFAEASKGWTEGETAIEDLVRIADQNAARREAIERWFQVCPECLRFIVQDSNDIRRRIGVTCVLPITLACYSRYISSQIREFEISAEDIVSASRGGTSRNLCFQSFGVSDRLDRNNLLLLRRSILEHVQALSDPSGRCRIVAEPGTSAGFKEAKKFNMQYVSISKDRRPLFELNYSLHELAAIDLLKD